MEENESAFKHVFGKALLKKTADAFVSVYPSFNAKKLVALMPKLEPMEMKDRVRAIRDELKSLLPEDYRKALPILLKAAKKGKFDGFILWPFTEFVQTYGLEHRELSLDALTTLTEEFTSEWAVRPFLKKDPKPTLKYLLNATKSKNEHHRRWASEGSRPRLPWGERLHDFIKDPTATEAILDALKFDEALYVRKSVSNHLNDLAKDHPEYVIETLKRWKKQAGKEHLTKIEWIIRRSLRTLIKDGNPGALELIGVSKNVKLKISKLDLHSDQIKLGDHLSFEFKIHSLSDQPQKLVVDYIIHFAKANQKTAPKVFKLKNVELLPNAVLEIKKKHPVKKITTRQYYAGKHFIELQINGVTLKRLEWFLSV